MNNIINKIFRKASQMVPNENNKLFSPLRPVSKNEIKEFLTDSWQSPDIPKRQYELYVKSQLENYRRGQPEEVFDVFIDILINNIEHFNDKVLLEIGCSSGYYSEVLKIRGVNLQYHGCDYSGTFIEFARGLFHGIDFQVQDACSLSYADESIDIVVSGCCLLHIMNYEKAIEETARVAKEYVIFHRTPVLHKKGTSYFIKTAYGVKMFEIHFNERELLKLMKKNDLKVVDIITFNAGFEDSTGDFYAYKTYLCQKG